MNTTASKVQETAVSIAMMIWGIAFLGYLIYVVTASVYWWISCFFAKPNPIPPCPITLSTLSISAIAFVLVGQVLIQARSIISGADEGGSGQENPAQKPVCDSREIEAIRWNATNVRSLARRQLGPDLDFDVRGVQWLNSYIQRAYRSGGLTKSDGLVSSLGSFLGECIIQSYGGIWTKVDGSWCVHLDGRGVIFPFAEVTKQLENGVEDSVLSSFTQISNVSRPPSGTGDR